MSSSETPINQIEVARSLKPLLAVITFAISLLWAGDLVFLSLRDAIKTDQKEQVASIGRLKVNQIQNWLDDRHSDIKTLSSDSYFALDVQRWLASGMRDTAQRDRIRHRLEAFIEAHHYHSIDLYDGQGNFVLRSGNYIEYEENLQMQALQAMANGQIMMIDLHRHADPKLPVGLGFISALSVEGHAIGAIYFSENPTNFLFPLVEAWPVNSETAEVQLVRAEGDRVLFLSKLRKRSDAPLTFSLPLNTPNLAAARAAQGASGLLENAKDYLGVVVLSYAEHVEGTPWVLITKVSEAEAYALVDRIEVIAMLLLLIFILIFSVWLFLWRKRTQAQADAAVLQERVRSDVLQLEAEKRFRTIFEHNSMPMMRTSISGEFIEINDAFTTLFGYSRDEVMSKQVSWQQITYPEDLETSATLVKQLLDGTIEKINFEKRYLRKDGSIVWGSVQASLVRNEMGKPEYFITAIQDITEHKRAEQQVSFMAYHDKLTGLPNRALFFDRLSQAMSQARRSRKHVALLYLDLDGFKPINDLHGHEAGDAVLKMVAQRLLACVRGVDTVARLGGDEFGIVAGDLDEPAEIERVAEKILHAFAQGLMLPDGQQSVVGVSIGISIYPDNGDEMDSLLAAADSAMYDSKHGGKNAYSYFGGKPAVVSESEAWIVFDSEHHVGVTEIDEQHRELVRLVNRLNGAIKNKEGDEMIRTLYDELVKFAVFHFETEHRLMERYHYPEIAAHDHEHAALVDEAKHFQVRINQGGELLALQSIKDWLLNHIHFTDKALAKYLIAHGVH